VDGQVDHLGVRVGVAEPGGRRPVAVRGALTPATTGRGTRAACRGAARRPVPRCPARSTCAGQLPDGTTLPLCRLRYAGSATTWGFAVYRASHNDYAKSVLPSGYPAGTPQEALDCACGLYLGEATAWLDPPPPTN
jgi:hypothetical protein